MKRFDSFDFTEILVKSIVIVAVTIMVFTIGFGIANESNRISEGVVIDKSYSPAYTSYQHIHHSKGSTAIPTYHAETYQIRLQGEKDEKTVTYWRQVTEQEYHSVNVGDYYPKYLKE